MTTVDIRFRRLGVARSQAPQDETSQCLI